MMSNQAVAETVRLELPALPLTIEGAAVLHQMMRFRWSEWRKRSDRERATLVSEAVEKLSPAEVNGQSAVFSLLGHKGDLLFVHFRDSFPELTGAQLSINTLGLGEFMEPTASYVSVVELGLYESTVKLYRSLTERGVAEQSDEWKREVQDLLNRQRTAMKPRLFPKIPEAQYVCFYPMDRKRGEDKNWYTLPIEERQRQMDQHGSVGRRYAGRVQQIISGSIGFDDWEWGVDLFGNDPVIFKQLIYEMRFDEVSGVYSNFGTFYIAQRCPVAQLGNFLSGRAPENKL
jgi:hydrogen peroxide-dependent heme synthase